MTSSTNAHPRSHAAGSPVCSFGKSGSQHAYRLNVDKFNDIHHVLASTRQSLEDTLINTSANNELLKSLHSQMLLSDEELGTLFPVRSSASGIYSPTTNAEDKNPASCTNILESRLIKKRAKIFKNWNLKCMITLVMCFVLGCLAGMTAVGFITFLRNTPAYEANDNICVASYQIARSLNEFLEISNRTSIHFKKSVSLRVLSHVDWPIGTQIDSSKAICDLAITGRMHPSKIVDLLAHTKVQREIRFINEGDMICSEARKTQSAIQRPIVKLLTQKLVLEDFVENCDVALNSLENQIEMTGLKEIQFIRGSLNSENMLPIAKLLSKSRLSLNRIEILDTKVNVVLFQTMKMITYPNVKTIRYDAFTGLFSATHSRFCSKFPNLEHYYSGDNMKHPNDEMSNLLECSKLKTMKTRIHENGTVISVEFLKVQFPLLESAEIDLDFSKCQHTENGSNRVRGMSKLPEDLLANLEFTSKCSDIIFE